MIPGSMRSGEIGDPTETALVRLGEQQGISEDELRAEEPRIFEIPFDSDRKRMSTLHQIKGEEILVSKGAADGLLPLPPVCGRTEEKFP